MTQAAAIRPALTAFGEVLVAQPSARVQVDATYGLRLTDWIIQQNNGATCTTENTGTGYEFVVSTGSNSAAFGRLRTKRIVRYRTGQGILLRFTARFGAPQMNSNMRVTGGNNASELGFGYLDKTFGILYANGGIQEVRTLTMTAAAFGAETFTITLNSVAKAVTLSAGTIAHNCAEIAAATFPGWEVYQNGNTVIFVADKAEPRPGTYSDTSTGTSNGTIAATRIGISQTINFIPQSQWNIDKMDGTGRSGIKLDPTKGNVYEIQQQYLGYGALLFSIENPGYGKFQEVHRVEFANANVSPNMSSPYMRLMLCVENTGNTIPISMYSASLAGFIEGDQHVLRDLRGFGNAKVGIGTTFTSIIAFRCSRIFAARVNRAPIWPHIFSLACDGTKNVEAIVVVNPTITSGEPNWTYIDSVDSTMEYDVGIGTISGGRRIFQFSMGKVDQLTIQSPENNGHICLSTGDIICIAMRATAVTSDCSASMSWEEE